MLHDKAQMLSTAFYVSNVEPIALGKLTEQLLSEWESTEEPLTTQQELLCSKKHRMRTI